MPLQCNIDAKGKKARLINGIVLIVIAAALALFWALPAHSALAWIIAAILFACGSFAVFEARAGWCALRAAGIKTRI